MSNIMEKFENSYTNCIGMLINQEHYNVDADSTELKLGVEHTMDEFLEAARQMNTFFLQKKLILTSETGVKDSVEDLRNELQRKEQLLQRQQDKVNMWLNIISRSSGSNQGASSSSHIEPTNENT